MPAIKSTTIRTLRGSPFTHKRPRISAGIAASARTSQSLSANPQLRSQPQSYYIPPHKTRHSAPNYRPKQIINCPSPTSTNSFTDLQNSIATHLANFPASSLSPTLPELFSLLRSYTSDPRHWSEYAHANTSKQYTRNLVCEVPGLFNLLILVWTPGKKSPVHDHTDSHCLMKVRTHQVYSVHF